MSDMINYYEELDQLLREAGESPASLSTDTEYKELKAVCRKLRKTWSTRANANTDKKELAQQIVDLLNLISQTIGSEEEKQAYDHKLRELFEEERRRREEEERREREYRERMERLAAAERRRQEEERKRLEEEERKRREELRRQEEQRQAARREQLAREARAARERELKRRAPRPSIIGFLLNVALVVLILWPTLSLTGVLPKPIAFAPAAAYREYCVSDSKLGDASNWLSKFNSTFRSNSSEYAMSSLFDETNANYMAADGWTAPAVTEGSMVVSDGNYLHYLEAEPLSVQSRAYHLSGSDRTYTGPDFSGGRLFVQKKQTAASIEDKGAIHSTKFYKDIFQKKTPEEIGIALAEILERGSDVSADKYYACAYAKAQGILLSFRDGISHFAFEEGDTISLYEKRQGTNECRLLNSVKRDYRGTGSGYFAYGNLLIYADGNAVKYAPISGTNAESHTILEYEHPVHEINYTVSDGVTYLLAYDLTQGYVGVISLSDFEQKGGIALEPDREAAVLAHGDVIWSCYRGESGTVLAPVLAPVRRYLDAAMPYVIRADQEESILKKYVLYNMTLRHLIGEGQATFRKIHLNEVFRAE